MKPAPNDNVAIGSLPLTSGCLSTQARVGMNHVRTAVSTDGDGDAPQWRWSGGLWLDHQWYVWHVLNRVALANNETGC